MANEEQLKVLRQGVKKWNEWRKEYRGIIHPDLRGADLPVEDFRETDFREADLRMANLNATDLSGAHLNGADLRGAHLRGAHLRGAHLSGAHLNAADLRAAHLCGADLCGAHLSGADFHGADLCAADLSWTHLCAANFSAADFSRANLRRAYLSVTNLSGANFRRTHLGETLFSDTNLTDTEGLATCIHHGPSTLDHRTLAKSVSLPLAFLRGVGLTDLEIEFANLYDLDITTDQIKDVINRLYASRSSDPPIQFYSCFISYSSKDEDFAQRLHADFQDKGVRCWFAPGDSPVGKMFHEQLDQAIRVDDRLVLILSAHSMESEWVKTEIVRARQKEIEQKRRVLFPLRLVDMAAIQAWQAFDANTGKDSAREIRKNFIPDFSAWKEHDAYQQAFDRLLRNLKAGEHPPGE